jgi:peptide/nickel transport system permease protein
MAVFIISRLAWGIAVLWAVATIVFGIFFVLQPADPAVALAGKDPTPSVVKSLRKEFGTDQPLVVQYGRFMENLVLGDKYGWPGFGFSYETRSPVLSTLGEKLVVSLQIAAGAAILWVVFGVAFGVIGALRPKSVLDRGIMVGSVIGVSAPTFWVGLFLLYLLWQKLHWLPGTGYVPPSDGVWTWFTHMLMPWITLAVLAIGTYARLIRSSLSDVLQEEYIKLARAKGLSRRRVVTVHALRPSLVPALTVLGVGFGTLLAGAVVTESVFNMPGLGLWIVEAAFTGDIPVIMAGTLVAAVVILLANLAVDIGYRLVDPRTGGGSGN